jgi:hypothetical protein
MRVASGALLGALAVMDTSDQDPLATLSPLVASVVL